MKKLIERPILVTGAARSGTSVISGLIEAGGAWGGEMAPGNPNNPLGFFENLQIRNGVIKPMLKHVLGVDPLGQKPLPKLEAVKEIAEEQGKMLHQQVLNIMRSQGYDERDKKFKDVPWFYKGAKACLVWPVWQVAFPEARWVITKRNEGGNITSCMRTPFMQRYANRAGWKEWLDVHYRRFTEMIDAGMDVTVVDMEKIIDGDYSEVEAMFEKFELDFDPLQISQFVRPEYWERG